MTLNKQTIWPREYLIDLLEQADVEELWDKWLLPQNIKKDKKSPEFTQVISNMSNTTLVQEILSLKTNTLQMIKDIITFLSTQNSRLRTTGSIIALNEEFELMPQQVNSILKWSQGALNKYTHTTWEEINGAFHEIVVPLFEKIKSESEVDIDWHEEDIVDTYIRALSEGSAEIRRTRIARYDEAWLKSYDEYVSKLEGLNNKLNKLRERDLPPEAQRLLSDIDGLYWHHKDTLQRYHYDIQYAHEESHKYSYEQELSSKEKDDWRQFVESILFLSDIEESGYILDILRLDLFRKRPQLYEIWILVSIASFFKRSGYLVEMLSLVNSQTGRVVWNLNYAKSKIPVAKLLKQDDKSEYFLFYQLFRMGESRDDMPDIALLPSNRPEDQPLWIIDPKHSEGKGYSLSNYREVALRYSTTFKSKQTWVVEYYPRNDLKSENALVFSDNAELIRDVSPNGAGYKYFLSKLREFHSVTDATTVIIDVSSSYVSNLNKVKSHLKQLQEQGIILSDTAILFSEKAKVLTGLIDLLENNHEWPNEVESEGTLLDPLLQLLEELNCHGLISKSLVIYTDCGFQDARGRDAIHELGKYGAIQINDLK